LFPIESITSRGEPKYSFEAFEEQPSLGPEDFAAAIVRNEF
jgi:hypothetical protein